MVSRTLLTLLIVFGLAACSSSPSRDSTAPAPQPPASVGKEKPVDSVRPAASLIEQGRQARVHGDFRRAQSLLQRAQRIDSRDAEVYLELSRLYAEQGEAAEATTMAERGLLYCDKATCKKLRALL